MTTADPPAPPDETPAAALARLIQPGPGETPEMALDRIARAVMEDSPPEEVAARLVAALPGEDPEDTYRRLTTSLELVRIRPLAVIFGVYEETAYGWNQEGPASVRVLPEQAKLPRMLNPHGYPVWHLGELLRWGEMAGKLVWAILRDGVWLARTVTGDLEPLEDLRARLGEKRVGPAPAAGDRGWVSIRYTRLMRPGPARGQREEELPG